MEKQIVDPSGIEYRQGILLERMLRAAIVLGGLAILAELPTFPDSVTMAQRMTRQLPYYAGWLILLLTWRWRGLGYRVRVIVLILLTYVVGIIVFARGGLAGGGRLWLMLIPGIYVTLLGPRYVIPVAVLCIVTYVASAVALNLGWFVPSVAADLTDVKPLFTEGATFVLVIVGFTLILSWSTNGFFSSLAEAQHEATKNQAILQGIADGVLVFDSSWRVTVINPAILKLVGLPASEVVGQDIEKLMSAGDSALDATGWSALHDMISTGQPARFEWGDKTLSASMSLVRDPSGEATGSVAVLRDVTREMEVERARESMFAVAAHELRTPLNAIINFANMMRAGILPPESLQNTARRIAVNGERLLILVNNLLERAKMEVGQVRLSVKRFALGELIDGVRGIMDVLAQEKGLALDVQIAEDMPVMISGDEQRLYQVLINLISNAIKFTKEGTVRVSAYLSDAEHWALEVSDTGAGIPEEARGRIFEPFELAEDPVTRKHAGAGLGLSIVKRSVELMGGKVTLVSEIGCGSTFTVVLPLVPDESQAS